MSVIVAGSDKDVCERDFARSDLALQQVWIATERRRHTAKAMLTTASPISRYPLVTTADIAARKPICWTLGE